MKMIQLTTLLKRAGLDAFILALLGMILLARLWPAGGAGKGAFSLSAIANYGVSVIFFFYGLRLSPGKLKAGLSKWRLHCLVHITTFIVFPLLLLLIKPLLAHTQYYILWLGTFFLASLPSTVSSSVVMVSIAGGNMPAAIFNASISSLLGVFITPLWMKLEVASGTAGIELSQVIGKLFVQVLLPVIAGILLHKYWGSRAEQHKKKLRYFDQAIILLIVYTSFCDSFSRHMFSSLTALSLLVLALCMISLFFLVYLAVTQVCRLLHFDKPDTIAAVFCASKKSLVHGTVMSKVLFGGTTLSGIILLPLMMYHALQLVAASMLARSMARTTPESQIKK